MKICKCIQVSKVTFCSARFIYWFSEVLFGSARSYLAQRGYIRFSKVIFSPTKLYSVQQGYIETEICALQGGILEATHPALCAGDLIIALKYNVYCE